MESVIVWLAGWFPLRFKPIMDYSSLFILYPVCDACYQVTAERFELLARVVLHWRQSLFPPLRRSVSEHIIKGDRTTQDHMPRCLLSYISFHWCKRVNTSRSNNCYTLSKSEVYSLKRNMFQCFILVFPLCSNTVLDGMQQCIQFSKCAPTAYLWQTVIRAWNRSMFRH